MTESSMNLIWVVLFRTLQTALDAVPTLLCGLLIAGLLRGMVGPQVIRRWFTDDPRLGPVRAWLTGLLLPVCSFGILPIAWELKRAGVPRATVVTLLFAAPLVNPFGLLYAFQTLEGEGSLGLAALVCLLVGSFVTLVGMGVLVGVWLPESPSPPDMRPFPASGLRRIGVALLTVARGLNGALIVFLFVGFVGAGLLAIVPGGALERAVNQRSIEAPLRLALVAIPFQAAPVRGIVLVCELLLSGLSMGSALVFFMLGLGLHLGTLAWIATAYGTRVLFCTVPLVIAGSLIAAYALPISLPTLTTDSIKSCHFLEIESSGGYKVAKARALRATIINDAGEPQSFLISACVVLGVFWLAGLASSFLGERASLSSVMTHGLVNATDSREVLWSKPLSVPQRSFAVMALVMTLVVAGMYIYYPAPGTLLNQMDGLQVELAMALKSDPLARPDVLRLLAKWQRIQNKLVVADLLRRGSIRVPLRTAAVELRAAIDRLRSAINDIDSSVDVKTVFREARDAAAHCREVLGH